MILKKLKTASKRNKRKNRNTTPWIISLLSMTTRVNARGREWETRRCQSILWWRVWNLVGEQEMLCSERNKSRNFRFRCLFFLFLYFPPWTSTAVLVSNCWWRVHNITYLWVFLVDFITIVQLIYIYIYKFNNSLRQYSHLDLCVIGRSTFWNSNKVGRKTFSRSY